MINPFKNKKRLGRGLSSLIGDSNIKTSNDKVSISSIVPNKNQPRKIFEKDALEELTNSIKEIERVGLSNKYICVESYRNEEEKANLLYWQVTCEAFNSPEAWKWWFSHSGYKGDYSFIYFE